MADINQVITLGIGTPSGIPEFLTFGLQIAQPPVYLIVSSIVKIRALASMAVKVRSTASAEVDV